MKKEDREKIKKLLPNNYNDSEKEEMTNSLIEHAGIYIEIYNN
jgi:hypothetical protein